MPLDLVLGVDGIGSFRIGTSLTHVIKYLQKNGLLFHHVDVSFATEVEEQREITSNKSDDIELNLSEHEIRLRFDAQLQLLYSVQLRDLSRVRVRLNNEAFIGDTVEAKMKTIQVVLGPTKTPQSFTNAEGKRKVLLEYPQIAFMFDENVDVAHAAFVHSPSSGLLDAREDSIRNGFASLAARLIDCTQNATIITVGEQTLCFDSCHQEAFGVLGNPDWRYAVRNYHNEPLEQWRYSALGLDLFFSPNAEGSGRLTQIRLLCNLPDRPEFASSERAHFRLHLHKKDGTNITVTENTRKSEWPSKETLDLRDDTGNFHATVLSMSGVLPLFTGERLASVMLVPSRESRPTTLSAVNLR